MVQSMPVDWFTMEAPKVNLMCPFPEFKVGHHMPAMIKVDDILAMLAGPCSELQKQMQQICLNQNLAGAMGELLQSLTKEIPDVSGIAGLGLIAGAIKEHIMTAMGPLVVAGLEKVVGDILGELVITAILGSNPVTGILQAHARVPCGCTRVECGVPCPCTVWSAAESRPVGRVARLCQSLVSPSLVACAHAAPVHKGRFHSLVCRASGSLTALLCDYYVIAT